MNHFFQDIDGWFNCERLYADMVVGAENGARFVEVGTWKGRSAAFMAVEIINSGKDIRFDVVDHFLGGPEHTDMDEVKNDTLMNSFVQNMEPVASAFHLWAMPSVRAARAHRDHTLDFCYIDASHAYEDVKADILAWLPKMKPGTGLLAGDDYDCYPGVRRAVDELLPGVVIHGNIWKYSCPSP